MAVVATGLSSGRFKSRDSENLSGREVSAQTPMVPLQTLVQSLRRALFHVRSVDLLGVPSQSQNFLP